MKDAGCEKMRRRILFLPADSIRPRLSRSYFLAANLAKFHDVFLVRWQDPGGWSWVGERKPPLNSVRCLIGSLLQFPRTVAQDLGEPGLFFLRMPVLLDAVVKRLVGPLAARRLARAFNGWQVAAACEARKMDLCFHADNFYYFPPVSSRNCPIVGDIQDDFDEPNETLMAKETEYNQRAFASCALRYGVSDGIAERMRNLTGQAFDVLPNGADFRELRGGGGREVEELKRALGVAGRLVISYIGSRVKCDPQFVAALAGELAVRVPDAVILLVGNLPKVDAANVLSVGLVSPLEIGKYYQVSDFGAVFRADAAWRHHHFSVPLKVIQYSAARKWVLVGSNDWLKRKEFPNVRVLGDEVRSWVDAVIELRNQEWKTDWDALWEEYDWVQIARRVLADLELRTGSAWLGTGEACRKGVG